MSGHNEEHRDLLAEQEGTVVPEWLDLAGFWPSSSFNTVNY